MARDADFDRYTQKSALVRQGFHCALCGTTILMIGQAGREAHAFGEAAHGHHIVHATNQGGSADVDNCVMLCEACHYNVHFGGNYGSRGKDRAKLLAFKAKPSDYPYYTYDAKKIEALERSILAFQKQQAKGKKRA